MDWMNMLIKPMEPVSQKEPFNSANHIFELKWDGIRLMAFSNGGQLRLQNRNLKDRTEKFPELHNIAQSVKAREVLLDGEVVVLWQGKPSFHRVMERAMATSESLIKSMVKKIPVVYVVFDILFFDGKWLVDEPIEKRKDILQEILVAGPNLELSQPLKGEGINIFEAVSAQKLEGIVAKQLGGKYIVGKKDKRWLKIKRRIEQSCIILGFYSAGPYVTSLIMGAFSKGRLIYIGRVASGLSNKEGLKLYELLTPIRIPGKASDLSKKHKGAEWVEPRLVAQVEFMEWTEDYKMRAPVYRKILWDHPLEECELN